MDNVNRSQNGWKQFQYPNHPISRLLLLDIIHKPHGDGYFENDSADEMQPVHEYVNADVRLNPDLDELSEVRQSEVRDGRFRNRMYWQLSMF